MSIVLEPQKVEEPVYGEDYIHLRFEDDQDRSVYLCGQPVLPHTPSHGLWYPATATEDCPHCGMPICPKCYDLALTFIQLRGLG